MKIIRMLRLLIAGFAAVLLVAACGDDDVSVDDVTEEPGIPPEIEGLDIDGADQYVGQEVTVEGEVSAQINDTAFHIASDGDGDGLLVLTEDPVVDRLDSDDVVRVTGTVREIDRETFDSDFGLLWDEDYGEFGTRHAIDATEVEVVGENADD